MPDCRLVGLDYTISSHDIASKSTYSQIQDCKVVITPFHTEGVVRDKPQNMESGYVARIS